MRASELVKYYSQKEFREFMLEFSKNREMIPKFRTYFGERPQTYRFDGELVNTIRKGVSSFHFSQERWRNVEALSTDLRESDLNDLRVGWDLVFDVDTKHLDYAKICTKLLIDALEIHDITDVSVKYSGGSGFHIGFNFNNPTSIKGQPINELFPDAARIVGLYLQAMIKDYLHDLILEKDSLEIVNQKTGLDMEVLDPLKVVNIDPVAIAPRHLIRGPYSLNEKQWLVSVPIKPKHILDFEKEEARPANVKFNLGFLDKPVNALNLFTQAYDWHEKEEKKVVRKTVFKKSIPKTAVVMNHFPPCIQAIQSGLEDGRKRSLFILVNFYHKCGYDWDSIHALTHEWNEKNKPPLKSNYVTAQIKWAESQGGLMPQNCTHPNYKDMGVCNPDNLCEKIKNPVTYALHKNKYSKKRRRKKKSVNNEEKK